MSHFLDNILSGPAQLLQSLNFTLGPGRPNLDAAARLIEHAPHFIITGIGSSWHAGIAVASRFDALGKINRLHDASELLHFSSIPKNSVLLMISRSGSSIEIVKLLEKAAAANAPVIALTNTPDSPLAKAAAVVLPMATAFDHNVSVNMYSAPILVGILLAENTAGALHPALQNNLAHILQAAEKSLPAWQNQIENSAWFDPALPAYFLARGPALAACHEARLLWEEAAKAPATAMTTGGFRHGPQEILAAGARIGLWLDPNSARAHDLALVHDLESRGAKVMLIGQNLPHSTATLPLSLPELPPDCSAWQPLIEIIPAQLAAFHMANLRHADSDNFLICPYIITTEGGLAST